MPQRLIELTGQRFGRWTVLFRVSDNDERDRVRWYCRCDCGTEKALRSDKLRSGVTQSCGCLQRELAASQAPLLNLTPGNFHHGYARRGQEHPLYGTWVGMRKRCDNPNRREWSNYGGRGIYVCDRWQGPDGFVNFLADMGEKPGPRYSVDRIDNDGPYSPENCRWATDEEQARNRRPVQRAAAPAV